MLESLVVSGDLDHIRFLCAVGSCCGRPEWSRRRVDSRALGEQLGPTSAGKLSAASARIVGLISKEIIM